MALELSPGDPMMLHDCADENFRWMAHDPDLDVLRSEPRLLELVRGR